MLIIYIYLIYNIYYIYKIFFKIYIYDVADLLIAGLNNLLQPKRSSEEAAAKLQEALQAAAKAGEQPPGGSRNSWGEHGETMSCANQR
jgi:hypothetical protein